MRGATACAGRLKRLMRSLRSRLGKVSRPPIGDPITQLILGIFSRDMPESKARDVLDRLRKLVVDYNELRVMSPREMAEHIGEYRGGWTKCEDVSRALNRCFATQHAISLDHLIGRPKRDVREFLNGLDGLDAYTRARIRLLGLQQHAMPLDEAMWAYARKTGIVDQKCPLETAQNFLERQIAENDALEVYALLKKQAWSDMGAAVRHGDVAHIHSVPPNRESRNMLQPIRRMDSDQPEEAREAEAPAEPERARKRAVTRKPPSEAKPVRAKTKPRAKPAGVKKTNAAKVKKKSGRRASARKARAARKLRPSPRKRKAKSA